MAESTKKEVRKLIWHSFIQSMISLALIVSVIGFYCTINTSLAWFSKSNKVSASDMSVSVKKSTDTVAYLHSYPILDISDNKYTISYENESFTLPTNDPNEISFSIYKKALAVIIDITTEEEGDRQIAITASSSLEDLSLENNFLSNCVSVKRAVLSGDKNDIATTTGATERFLAIGGVEATKTNEIMLDTVHVSQNTKVCYIIEYDVSLLNYVHDEIRAKNPVADFVAYANDLDFIIY